MCPSLRLRGAVWTFRRARSWNQDLNSGFRRNSWITFTHTSPLRGTWGGGGLNHSQGLASGRLFPESLLYLNLRLLRFGFQPALG